MQQAWASNEVQILSMWDHPQQQKFMQTLCYVPPNWTNLAYSAMVMSIMWFKDDTRFSLSLAKLESFYLSVIELDFHVKPSQKISVFDKHV